MQKKEYDRHENQSDLTYHMITDWLNSAADNRATEKNIKMSVDAISSEITNQTFRKALAILLRQPVSTDGECCRNRFSDDTKNNRHVWWDFYFTSSWWIYRTFLIIISPHKTIRFNENLKPIFIHQKEWRQIDMAQTLNTKKGTRTITLRTLDGNFVCWGGIKVAK